MENDNVIYLEQYRDPTDLTPEQRRFWESNKANWDEQIAINQRGLDYALRQKENAARMLGEVTVERGLGQKAVRRVVAIEDKEDLW